MHRHRVQRPPFAIVFMWGIVESTRDVSPQNPTGLTIIPRRASAANSRKIEGFINSERFNSERRPGWILPLSTWRDEKIDDFDGATGMHHIAQTRARRDP